MSCSVVTDSFRPHGLRPTRLLCPWDSPGENTGVGCHAFLRGIFPTQGSNPGLPHCRRTLYCLSRQHTLVGDLFQVDSCQLRIVSSGGSEPKEEASSLMTVTQALVSPLRILPLWLHLIKITFWRPHLLIPSHCVEGFQLANFQQILSL